MEQISENGGINVRVGKCPGGNYPGSKYLVFKMIGDKFLVRKYSGGKYTGNKTGDKTQEATFLRCFLD